MAERYRRVIHGAVASDDVRRVQQALLNEGHPPGPVDGVYGFHTARAVSAFQRAAGLAVDGLVGPRTWRALASRPGGQVLGSKPFRGLLHGATSGDDVRTVQEALRAVGLDPGEIDGVYGPATASAVKAFQRGAHLAANGIVEAVTWSVLVREPISGISAPEEANLAYRIASGLPVGDYPVLAAGFAHGHPIAVVARDDGLICLNLSTGERVGAPIRGEPGAYPTAVAIADGVQVSLIVSRWSDGSILVTSPTLGYVVGSFRVSPTPDVRLSAVQVDDILYVALPLTDQGVFVQRMPAFRQLGAESPPSALAANVEMPEALTRRHLAEVGLFPSREGLMLAVLERQPSEPDAIAVWALDSEGDRTPFVGTDAGFERMLVAGTHESPVLVTRSAAGLVERWRNGDHISLPGMISPDGADTRHLAATTDSVYIAGDQGPVRRFLLSTAEPQGAIAFSAANGMSPRIASLAAGGDGDSQAVAVLDADGTLWGWSSSRPADPVAWQDDAPAREDMLRRRPLAEAIAKRLRLVAQESPVFLLHLNGPWGSGKSTVLRFLSDQLTEEEPRWLLVPFNAWRQVGVGPPWWALMAALREALRTSLPRWTRLRFRVAEWFRLRLAGSPAPAALLLLTALAAGFFFLIRPARLDDMATLIQGAAAVLTAVGTLWAGVLTATRMLSWSSQRGARLFEESDRNPRESVAQHFSWLVARSPRPIVLIIDDLDRCPAGYVVDLLESVHTLIKESPARPRQSSPVAVVVAADGTWIRRAFEQSYDSFAEAVAEPGRPLGYLFLDKIFQLSVPMPAIGPETQRGYVTGLLAVAQEVVPTAEVTHLAAEVSAARDDVEMHTALSRASQSAREQVAPLALAKQTETRFQKATEHRLQKYLPLLPPNPRAVKRFLNDYTMLRAVRTAEGIAVGVDTLALWTILRTRWPLLADHLANHPDDVTKIGPALGPADGMPPLFSAPAVVELVHFPYGGPLTPQDIRVCSGAG